MRMSLEDRVSKLAREIRSEWESDELLPTERAIASWNQDKPDRLLGGFAISVPEALGIPNISARQYYTDAHAFFYVNLLAALEWSNEFLVFHTDPYIEVEALGGKLNYPESKQPWLGYPLLASPRKLTRYRVPDPLKDGRMPTVVQIAALHKEHLADVLPACVSCRSPLSLAVMMRGFDRLLEDTKRDSLFVHDFLQLCCETTVAYGSAILGEGEMCLNLIAPWESLLRRDYPELFYEFALPYLSRCVSVLSACESRIGPLLWSTGMTQVFQWKRFLAILRGIGASALTTAEEEIFGWQSYRRTDLPELKDTCSSLGVVLVINLSPDTVLGSSPERLRRHMVSLFEAAAGSGGMVVTTTIPVGATSKQIHGFSRAIHACRYIPH